MEAAAVSPVETSRSPMEVMEATFFVDLLKSFDELRAPLNEPNLMLTFLSDFCRTGCKLEKY